MNSQRQHLISKLFALVLFLPFLGGCNPNVFPTPNQDNIDKSFLTGEACELPCWYGLIINKSTKDDVIATLNTLPFVEHNTYKEYSAFWANDLPATEIQFTCASDHRPNCGGILISDNTVKRIWTVLQYNFTIKDAVRRLGPPEFVEYEWPSMSGECSLNLLWVSNGVSAGIYDNRSYNECENIIDGNRISPDLAFNDVTYISPDNFGEPADCCQRVAWPGIKNE